MGSADDPSATGEEPDVCGVVGSSISGVFDFWGMVGEGYLSENGTAAEGMLYRYDSCTQTPYVWKEDTEVMISYDDAASFGGFICFYCFACIVLTNLRSRQGQVHH